jgi:hypothetical protein
MPTIDYMDADVAYLLGMLVARGELFSSENVFRMIVHFPKSNLQVGRGRSADIDQGIQLGMEKIRNRLHDLLGCDIRAEDAGRHWDLIMRFSSRTMAWRNIAMHLEEHAHFAYFKVPEVLFQPDTPREYKREFLRGYADVGANIRPSNRDINNYHRVRMDVLNNPGSWQLPVQLCILLQEHLGVSVPNITWGHPNMNRVGWKEHQLNIYAEHFLDVGFVFDYKQRVLEELATANRGRGRPSQGACPGEKRWRGRKSLHSDEHNADRLDPVLVGKHFDAYWQICRELGCHRRPPAGQQLEMVIEDTV